MPILPPSLHVLGCSYSGARLTYTHVRVKKQFFPKGFKSFSTTISGLTRQFLYCIILTSPLPPPALKKVIVPLVARKFERQIKRSKELEYCLFLYIVTRNLRTRSISWRLQTSVKEKRVCRKASLPLVGMIHAL